MAQDRWNDYDRYREEPLWGEGRRREGRMSQDWRPEDYDRYEDDRSRRAQSDRAQSDRAQSDRGQSGWAQSGRAQDDEARYRPFGDTGPISTRSGAYSGEGRPYGASGRYDDLSPTYREFELTQRRIHRGDYDPDRYTPNPREGRGEEPRSWWDRTQDEVSSWFGDEHARRRREWDERQADVRSEYGADAKAEHRGRGPKGYQRSDARIAEDLNDRLTDDPYLDASDIEVSVSKGEVTLSGLVARREDKRRAEDLADRILGVGHVQNNLRVKPTTESASDYIVP